MNSNNQPQGPQGSGQQRPYSNLIRAEQIPILPHLDDDQKAKWVQGVKALWENLQKHPPDSEPHKMAYSKLTELSQKIRAGYKSWLERQQQGAARPQSQGQPSQPAQQQPPQNQPAQQPSNQPQGPPQPSAQVLQHVRDTQYFLPPDLVPGSEQAEKRLRDIKASYMHALAKQEHAVNQIKRANALADQIKAKGQEVPDAILKSKSDAETQYQQTRSFTDDWRKQQALWKAQRQQIQHQQQGGPQIKVEGNSSAPNAPAPQPFNLQLPGQASQQNPVSDAPSVNPAVETTRNSVNLNRVSPSPSPSGQPPQNAQPQTNPATHTPTNSAVPTMQMHQQPSNFNVNRPSLNTQQPAQGNQMQHNSPHAPPNAAVSQPVPLTHQAAMSAAARTYSNQQPTSQVPIGQGHQQIGNIGNRDQINNPKMPIPKNLNVAPPQPVSMPPSRPTMGGPTNSVPGMLSQPVISKHPTFNLEGEGDRVLSKKKLDELVRQVTGGDGSSGEGLTPEVEEVMLQAADEFVDSVITSACRLAKLRDSPTLDIRDLQLILERNYNIRIPGYASDEVRTVRKFHPAAGWTQKMNAVQAAKVMGGKTDI